MSVVIREALAAEAARIADLGRETFYETWRPLYGEADLHAYLAVAFDHAAFQREVESPLNTFILAEEEADGELLGYAKIRRDTNHAEFAGARAIEIERVYVRGKFHRAKLGTRLMERVLAIAEAERFEWAFLGVDVRNERAQALYRGFGFEIFGKKIVWVGAIADPDFLMKKRLV